MENLKEISLSQEIFSCEHLNANKVYFSEKVLDDNRIMPVYHQLCMLLDIYDVKHELKEEKSKTIKTVWHASNGCDMSRHHDSLVRYIGDNKVLMTNCAEYDAELATALKAKLEADGYEVKELAYDSCTAPRNYADHSWAYINYIQTSNVIIVPMQRAQEDKEALRQIKDCFPNLAVVGVYANPFFSDGGEFKCYSQSIVENSAS